MILVIMFGYCVFVGGSIVWNRLELQAGRIINVENENQYPPNVASIYAA